MSPSIWTPAAVSSEARPWTGAIWRMVEAQHVASTMKLVDSRDEQDALEALLESSKPPYPKGSGALDYLLATPFRYVPEKPGSRFRGVNDPGVFYGAESVRTASAELGYWRWKFLMDAVDLEQLGPVAHTAFSADVRTLAIDLRKPPLRADEAWWTHPVDYTRTQSLARVARASGVGGIVYRSVRDPRPAWCMALLEPSAFTRPKPRSNKQTWWLSLNRNEIVWRHDREAITFLAAGWKA